MPFRHACRTRSRRRRGWRCEAWTALTGRPPLLTRGVVDIFRHDWSLDSHAAVRDLGLSVTPLTDGLERTLEALP